MITNRNPAVIKSKGKNFHKDICQQRVEDDCAEEDEGEDKENDDTLQTMCTRLPRCIKFESSPGHKAVLNYAMPYLVALMMTGPEFLKDTETYQINPWPNRNFIALDKTIIEV